MTSVLLVRGCDGTFKSFAAHGHAGFAAKGKDIVCAAETLLLRTAIQVLESTEGIEVFVDKSRRGHLSVKVEVKDKDCCLEKLRCVADFVGQGIKSLSQEYPRLVCLEEMIDGSDKSD